ncbi:MAG: M23 family metallopeptidase [Pseudomonadaceae bacterium]|nr:M23 family metallopeptidase [Pseudomonadaceae bacterium]
MKVLVFRDRFSKSLGFELSKATVIFAAMVFVAGVAGNGYWLYDAWVTDELDSDVLAHWRDELKLHRKSVDSLEAEVGAENAALGRRLAQLHARMLRMEALGERVTELADLQGDEFSFSDPIAVGGPESPADEMASMGIVPSFDAAIDDMAATLRAKEAELDVLESLLVTAQLREDIEVSGRPVRWGWVSSPYGQRVDPITGKVAWHAGVDFAGKEGADVIAVASGVVVFSGEKSGYGNFIEINHGNGLATRYAHHRELLVEPGQIVRKGQTIAVMGSTGRSTGPHVHFEVLKNGRTQDPSGYIAKRS